MSIKNQLVHMDVVKFGTATAVALVTAFGIFSFYSLSSMINDNEWVQHSNDVISSGGTIEKLIIDLETGQRGFLITGKETFLEPYDDANSRLNSLLTETKILVNDNPEQVRRIEEIESLIRRWHDEAGNNEIEMRRAASQSQIGELELQERVAAGTGKNILDAIRLELDALDLMFVTAGQNEGRTQVLAVAKDLVDMETGQRGYLITGDTAFLEPYQNSKAVLAEHITDLHTTIDGAYDRRIMLNDVSSLQALATNWQSNAVEPIIALRQQVTNGSANQNDIATAVSSGRGKIILDELRLLADDMNLRFQMARNTESVNSLLKITKDIADQEASERGYLITGDTDFLDPYEASRAALDTHFDELRLSVESAYNENQARRLLEKIEVGAQRWDREAGSVEIALRESVVKVDSTILDVIALIEQETGKDIMDQLRASLSQFKEIEQVLMETRQADANSTANMVLWLGVLGALLMIGFSITMGRSFARMQRSTSELDVQHQKLEGQDWVKSSYSTLARSVSGLTKTKQFADTLIRELTPLINAQMGLVYFPKDLQAADTELELVASYAFGDRKTLSNRFAIGEGMVGQCALEKTTILVDNPPQDYNRVRSGSGDASPASIIVFPIVFENDLLAVIELASLTEFSNLHRELVEQVTENIGANLQSIDSRQRTQELLDESQEQSVKLQAQQEELQSANEMLEEQTQQLKASEEELHSSNEELRSNQDILQNQKNELKSAHKDVEERAQALTQASKYKSEFLANMSHELRTPLNSMLILSQILSENRDGNLSEKQMEDVLVINSGGNDLLNLINDIMDLSKVEAGMLDMHKEDMELEALTANIGRVFNQVAQEKNLEFSIERDSNLPNSIYSDPQRVEQVLKNFLSNAFKFTEQGEVALTFHSPAADTMFRSSKLTVDTAIGLSVRDSGIGIAKDKQEAIFESFQQEDGSTSRKFGGTGLGLTISTELANKLGGEIMLQSVQGKGSTFTLFLPKDNDLLATVDEIIEQEPGIPLPHQPQSVNTTQSLNQEKPEPQSLPSMGSFISDDRNNILADDRTILIVEDDPHFAKILLDTVRRNGFRGVATDKGRDGLILAMHYIPAGVLLDLGLPDISGRSVLEQLKYHLSTHHIPIHVISGRDTEEHTLLAEGALSFLGKPIKPEAIESILAKLDQATDKTSKKVLVVEEANTDQETIESLLMSDFVEVISVTSGEQALAQIDSQPFDCIILDPGVSGVQSNKLLQQIAVHPENCKTPVIIYTGNELSNEDQLSLNKHSQDITIKGAESPERLLDDVFLFLHSLTTDLPPAQAKVISMLHDENAMLSGRRVLLVDDDMRNLFALSRQLDDLGLHVEMAKNGQIALDMLEDSLSGSNEKQEHFDLVLMDIMMPVMDGYEATRRIREMEHYADIPVIALTAKAMQEDREKCLQAGASEYLTKPIDIDKLTSILRIWLYQPRAA